MATNLPESRILPTTAGAKPAKRHIFRQDMSSEPRVPYAVSKKALYKCWHWPLRQWKLAFGSINPQELPTFRLHHFFHPFALRSGPHHRTRAFSYWKPCSECWWDPCTSLYVVVPPTALSDASAARDIYGNWGTAHPQPHRLRLSLDRCPSVLAVSPPHSPPMMAAGLQKAVYNWLLHPVLGGVSGWCAHQLWR